MHNRDAHGLERRSDGGGRRRKAGCAGSQLRRLRGEMFGTEMALDAASPRAHKRKIQRSADGGTGKGNHSPGPFLGGFLTELDRQPLRNAWRDFFEHLFFDEILAVVHPGRRRRGLPHFETCVLPARLESVEQAEALNEAQRYEREQAGVRKKRDHAAKAETRALGEGEAFGVANEARRNGVQTFERNVFHAREIRDPKAVLIGKFPAKNFRIDFDRAKAADKAEAQKTAENTSARRFFP